MDKRLAYAFVAGVALALWLNSNTSPVPSPFNPTPEPSRPVMRFIARAAKNALWLMLLAEPAPSQAGRQIVQHAVGEDGYPVIDHARAF